MQIEAAAVLLEVVSLDERSAYLLDDTDMPCGDFGFFTGPKVKPKELARCCPEVACILGIGSMPFIWQCSPGFFGWPHPVSCVTGVSADILSQVEALTFFKGMRFFVLTFVFLWSTIIPNFIEEKRR